MWRYEIKFEFSRPKVPHHGGQGGGGSFFYIVIGHGNVRLDVLKGLHSYVHSSACFHVSDPNTLYREAIETRRRCF